MTPTKWAFVEVMCSDLACGWFWGDLWWVNVVICDVWCYVTMLSSTTPLLQSTMPVPLRTAKYHSSTTKYYSRKHKTPHKHTKQSTLRNKTQPLQSAKTYDLQKHLLSDLLHLTNTIIAVRKDIRPEETFTFRSPTRNKHNHCSPQRHTILLLHFLLSSWPQSAKTYDLKKHVLSYLLHLTNTIIAVRKDIQYSLSIFSCLRGRNPQRHTTFWNIYFQISYTYQTQPWQSANADNIAFIDLLLSSWPQSAKTYDLKKHLLSYLLHLTNTIIAVRKTYNIPFRFSLLFVAAVRKDIRPQETFTFRSPTRNKRNHCSPQRHHLQCAEQQVSRSNRSKYCACHAKRLTS